jgi:hypothetical protein
VLDWDGFVEDELSQEKLAWLGSKEVAALSSVQNILAQPRLKGLVLSAAVQMSGNHSDGVCAPQNLAGPQRAACVTQYLLGNA